MPISAPGTVAGLLLRQAQFKASLTAVENCHRSTSRCRPARTSQTLYTLKIGGTA